MTTNRPKPPLRDYVSIINRYLERLETPNDLRFDEPGVAFYLANLRQLVEQKGVAADFRVVMFYANWILHSSLDHARTTGPLLERVSRAIIEHLDETTNASDEISRSIGFDVLRDQIRTLNDRYGIQNTIIENEAKWQEAVGQLCVQLTHKPVWLPTSGRQAAGIAAGLDLGQPVFWLTGERGDRVDWCVSFVPAGQEIDFLTLLDDPRVVTFTGGLFFA